MPIEPIAMLRLVHRFKPLQTRSVPLKRSLSLAPKFGSIEQKQIWRSSVNWNQQRWATSQTRLSSDGTSGPLPKETEVGSKRFADFHLAGKTFVVTGGARGLGLALAEALVEAGGRGECAPRTTYS